MNNKERAINIKEILQKIADNISVKMEGLSQPKNDKVYHKSPLSENSQKEIEEMTHDF